MTLDPNRLPTRGGSGHGGGKAYSPQMRPSQSVTDGAEILRLSSGFNVSSPKDFPSEATTTGGRFAETLHAEVSSWFEP